MAKAVKFDPIDFKKIEYYRKYQSSSKLLLQLFVPVMCLLPLYPYISVINNGRFSLGWFLLAMITFWIAVSARLIFKMNSNLVITGTSLMLKRPFGQTVDLPFSEMGSIRFSGERCLSDFGTSPEPRRARSPRPRYTESEYWNKITIKSIDGKKRISADRSLPDFDGFVRDLAQTMDLAELRYLGYKDGSAVRQPERTWELRKKLAESHPLRWFKRTKRDSKIKPRIEL